MKNQFENDSINEIIMEDNTNDIEEGTCVASEEEGTENVATETVILVEEGEEIVQDDVINNSETISENIQDDVVLKQTNSSNYSGVDMDTIHNKKGSVKKVRYKKSGKAGIIVLVIILLAVICCLGIYVVMLSGIRITGKTVFTLNENEEIVDNDTEAIKGMDEAEIEAMIREILQDEAEIEAMIQEILQDEAMDDIEVSVYDVSQVVENVMPAIVAVNCMVSEEESFWGEIYESTYESMGSGIIVKKNENELLVATNYHVVKDAEKTTVLFMDEESVDGQIKGVNVDMDLAIISINIDDIKESTLKEITVAKLGESDKMKVGEPVIAIGNALGYGQSVTTGVVSAMNREFEMKGIDDPNRVVTHKLIQTDAAINEGNSGGALLNMDGEVIGINSNKLSDTSIEGMCYAIPITDASPILDELIDKEIKVKPDASEVGYLGINGIQVTGEMTQVYGLPEGLYIRTVVEDSPAANAGLQPGDIITKFGGEKIYSMEALIEIVSYYSAGDTVVVSIEKMTEMGYEEQEIEVVLMNRPQQE